MLKLLGNTSLFQDTVQRFLSLCKPEDMYILSHEQYRFHLEKEIRELGYDPSEFHYVYEPVSRNTAPAIALGLRYLKKTTDLSKGEVIVAAPSDHRIAPGEGWKRAMERGLEFLQKEQKILVLGVPPRSPDPGFGYIQVREKGGGQGIYLVERFVEKPEGDQASRLLESGQCYWNAGIFLFRSDTLEQALREHSPEIAEILERSWEEALHIYPQLPGISLDYAVLEKSQNLAMIPLEGAWSDLGSFTALYELREKDPHGNAISGEVRILDTRNSMILGGKRLVVTLGVEGLLVVDADDALLVTRLSESQRIREIVQHLEQEQLKEVREARTVYRPWGSYTVLEEGERFKVKRITVLPGSRLSLQRHLHRSEHWVVVKGTARVTIEERVIFLSENESVFVPAGKKHRLENPGETPLEIVEVQSGAYVGEDDIERYEDDYGRDGIG